DRGGSPRNRPRGGYLSNAVGWAESSRPTGAVRRVWWASKTRPYTSGPRTPVGRIGNPSRRPVQTKNHAGLSDSRYDYYFLPFGEGILSGLIAREPHYANLQVRGVGHHRGGGERLDPGAERGRSPAEDQADGLLRDEDHRSSRRQEEGQEEAAGPA